MSSESAKHPGCAYAAWLLCGAGLFAGCAVGPNYKRPVINSPAAFRVEEEATNTLPATELSWWKVYEDAALQALIREALTNN